MTSPPTPSKLRFALAFALVLGLGCASAGQQSTSEHPSHDAAETSHEASARTRTTTNYGGAAPSAGGGEAMTDDAQLRTPQSTTVAPPPQQADPGGHGEPNRMVGGDARLEYTALISSDSNLATALSDGRCDQARDLRDRICDLSERICAIADDHPDHPATRERCQDGVARCESASDRVDRCR